MKLNLQEHLKKDPLMLHVTLPYDITETYPAGFTKIMSYFPSFKHFDGVECAIKCLHEYGADLTYINLPDQWGRDISVTDPIFSKCISQNKDGLLIYEPSAGYNPCSSSLKIPNYRLIHRIAQNLNYVKKDSKQFQLDLSVDTDFNTVFPKGHDIYNVRLNYMRLKSVGSDLTLCLTKYRLPHPQIVFSNLIKAIQELARASLVHTNITGSNIVYDEELKKVTLIDFGFSRKFEDFTVTPNDFTSFENYNDFTMNFDFCRGHNPIDMLFGKMMLVNGGRDKEEKIGYILDAYLTNATIWLWSLEEIESILKSEVYYFENFNDLIEKVSNIWTVSCKKYDIYSVGLAVANMYAVMEMRPSGYIYSLLKACTHPDYNYRLLPSDLLVQDDGSIICTKTIHQYSDLDVPDFILHPKQKDCACAIHDSVTSSKHTFREQAVCALGLCGKIDVTKCEIY